MDELYVIYDDTCRLCQSGVSSLRKEDLYGRVTFVPLSNLSVPATVALPPIENLRSEMHLIRGDGEVFVGAEAIAEVSAHLPRLTMLSPILRLPGIRTLAKHVYRLVARNRHRLRSGRDKKADGS